MEEGEVVKELRQFRGGQRIVGLEYGLGLEK